MDGDGEGMIAIIQALRDAGLAITVMDGRYQRLLNLENQARERLAIARLLALKKSLEVSQFHSAMETSMLEKPHRGAEVCNERYTSSYQTTHCNTSPARPQVDPPEYPPQRPSPSTTEGNFLVGGCRSGYSYTPVRDSRSYRKTIASQDKGPLYSNRIAHTSEFSNRVSRESEAFVYSLRKYPSISPERPGSAEMVQRLINYTQSKNSKKRWRKSKSMRSLADINRKPDIQTMNKSNKNVQTYTRSGSSSPVKNDATVNDIEEGNSRNFRLKSPVSDSRHVRCKDLQDDHLNETYDYLKYNKPSQRKFYRSPEVRYLTDVTKRFRDTLRQIYDDKPIMCQKMRNRYTNHEREYHPQRQRQPCDHHRPRVDFLDTEVQGAGNKIAEETFDSILEDWFANLSITSRKTCFEIIEVERLKADFKCHLEHLHMTLNKEAMRAEIRKFLLNFPLDPAKNNDEYINEKINELMELLESVPWVSDSGMYGDSAKPVHLEDSKEINRTSVEDLSTSKQVNLSLQSIRPVSTFRKSCKILSDYIMAWFNNLPIITDSSEQGEETKALKQSLSSQLINKIGEMNINQDIFNDDYLYQEILKDEIESLLNELPMNADLICTLSDLKEDLIYKIMESRERIKQEIAGQQYKRNLRDIISKTLPLQRSMNLQDLAELDVLKDHLADAYMNLHFYGADNGLLDKYKTKISDEITSFCNNYLNRHPNASVDNENLKLELFDALQNVEIPNEEILSGEIEKARIRDEINDWIKGISLKEQTKTELLQRNKMISLLAKKLHDNETDGELDDNEINDENKKEILKYLYKLPLTVNDNKIVGNYADKLIDNLNKSASSRRYNASKTLRSLKDTSLSLWKTIDNSTDDTLDKMIGKYTKESANLNESTKDRSSKHTRSNYIPSIPQSTLNTADRAHLEEIRERTLNVSSFRPTSTKRDAAVSALPTDVASQTDIVPTTPQKGIKIPNCLAKLPIYPEATCPSRLVGFTNPVDQPVNSISPMQQDVAIDNTEIGGSQEIRTTRPDQPEIYSGAIFNKEQNKEIEKGSEFQQQTDLPGPKTAASQVIFVRSITEDINPVTHGNLCPGVQHISKCYNKTCPSIKEFLQESNKNVGSTQEILYGQNAAAGPSKPDISPQVIIKEYYLGPSDQGTNRPGRSCNSINSRGDRTRTQQGRFPHRQYNEECASRPTQTSCSNIDCRRNFSPKYWVSDDEDFWINPNVIDDLDTRERVKREEKIRCKCKERVTSRSRCVQRCPHPSSLYFR